MYPRTIKVRSSDGTVNEYVRIVEAHGKDGKVKQRVVAHLGRKGVLLAVRPKPQRLLRGDIEPDESIPTELKVVDASTWGPVLAIRTLFDQFGLGASSTDVWGEPRMYRSLTGRLCLSPIG